MRRFFLILLALCMVLMLAACGEDSAPQSLPPEEPEVSAEELYQEGISLLNAGNPREAYNKLFSAAEAGSPEASEQLVRGVILNESLAEYANDRSLFQLCEERASAGDPWALWASGYCYLSGIGTGIDYKMAYERFQQAAETENPDVQAAALNDFGYMAENGFYLYQDTTAAMEYYRKAAELGNPYAMGNLGLAYAYGTLRAQDAEEGLEWFQKAIAADEDNANGAKDWLISSISDRGYWFLFPDDGSDPDYELARMYHESAAEYGNQDSLFYMGVLYDQAWGVKRDAVKAVEYYEKALDAGSGAAAYNLGNMFAYGDDGIERDLERALEYLDQSAELGFEDAAVKMGDVGVGILTGDGFKKDPETAVRWFEKAADAGHGWSARNLGLLYTYGIEKIPKDLDKGLSYFVKAAKLGETEDGAAEILEAAGNILSGKEGMKKDPETALKWFEESAKLGNVKAMQDLGGLYSDDGSGVGQDLGKAKSWYENAAKKGDEYSMRQLGGLYAYGDSENPDYASALEWYLKAAEACDPENKNDAKELKIIAALINNAGALSSWADSEHYDPELAFRAFTKAHELGDASAALNLGKAYGIGMGTEVDLDKAYELLKKGGLRGDKDAFLKEEGWFTSDP